MVSILKGGLRYDLPSERIPNPRAKQRFENICAHVADPDAWNHVLKLFGKSLDPYPDPVNRNHAAPRALINSTTIVRVALFLAIAQLLYNVSNA